MANFNISGTISPNGANATVTLTGTVAASTVATSLVTIMASSLPFGSTGPLFL